MIKLFFISTLELLEKRKNLKMEEILLKKEKERPQIGRK